MSKSKHKVKTAKQPSKDIKARKKQQSNPKKISTSHEKSASKKSETHPTKDDKNDFLPGQKYKSPEQDSGAMAFYTSLYQQNPKSQMAQKYCLQYGLLDRSQAQRILTSQVRASRACHGKR